MDTATATPLPLPFDDGLDAPIGFSLTPRARRTVVPEQLPVLRLVAPHEGRVARAGVAGPAARVQESEHDDPGDVRPAQARALRRSGMPVTTIAAAIGVDPDLVERWTRGAAPVRRRAAGRAVASRRAATTVPAASVTRASQPAPVAVSGDAAGAIGMAVALATFDTDGSGVTFTHRSVEVVAAVLVQLRQHVAVDERRIRVAIRAAERLGVDRCRASVARTLGVPAETMLAGRWVDATSEDTIEVTLRITDPAAVATVVAWVEGVTAPSVHDVASG